MKKAVLLHGTDGSPEGNWFPWLKKELEKHGFEVWVPQLPDADRPNAEKWTAFLLNNGWDFKDNLLIGHSAGAVEILHLLKHLPVGVKIRTAVLAAVFSHVLAKEPDWPQLKGLFEEPFDFEAIKNKAQTLLFVHGSNDPWCDPAQAEHLATQTEGEYVEVPGGQHFSASLDPSFKEFPALIQILEERGLL